MSPAPSRRRPALRCLVVGGSSGLGEVIAGVLAGRGERVMIVGRDTKRLAEAADRIRTEFATDVQCFAADVAQAGDADRAVQAAVNAWDGLDVLVNVVGASDRGTLQQLCPDQLQHSFEANVLTTLRCCQAAAEALAQSRGVVVNIGSLAGKVGARFLGGYNIGKHGVTALTQQLRMEWHDRGVHVGVVHPGPIRRDDAGMRYQDRLGDDVPESAAAPGGGTRVKGLDPAVVAKAVLRIIDRRDYEIILPRYLRFLIVLGNLSPKLGDWMLRKFTKG
ncbi:MAG: SDR family NAD(P)-dependent oxidoreductase [Planctomycetota bacterium]